MAMTGVGSCDETIVRSFLEKREREEAVGLKKLC